ncbi:MAG: hypothetical protein ACFB14_04950 [Leptolyngbyaceae cyanobacterium]
MAVAQITAQPVEPLSLGLSYVHSFNQVEDLPDNPTANVFS